MGLNDNIYRIEDEDLRLKIQSPSQGAGCSKSEYSDWLWNFLVSLVLNLVFGYLIYKFRCFVYLKLSLDEAVGRDNAFKRNLRRVIGYSLTFEQSMRDMGVVLPTSESRTANGRITNDVEAQVSTNPFIQRTSEPLESTISDSLSQSDRVKSSSSV